MLARKTQLLTIATALLIPAIQVAAQNNDNHPDIDIQAALGPFSPTLDGVLDEPEWDRIPTLEDPLFSIPKGPPVSGNYVNFEEHNGGTWEGPGDHKVLIRQAWDEETLYFGIQVIDDYHENSANSPWNGDSVQMMVANEDRDAQTALYNFALGLSENDPNYIPVCGDDVGIDCIAQEEAGPGGINVSIVRNNFVTTYEIAISAEGAGFDSGFQDGNLLGIGITVNDGDEDTPGQKGWSGWGAHSIVFGKTPSETGLLGLTLFPDTGARCDLNGDLACNIDDINLEMNEIAANVGVAADDGGPARGPSPFDLNDDGFINDLDRDEWLSIAATENGLSAPYQLGDTNLDLRVNAGDLNNLALAWQMDNHNWSDGNLTGAGVNAGDLNLLALSWQQAHPDAPAAASVPEPTTAVLLVLGIAGLAIRRRR